jgi:predicted amidohydrolase YtcJ
MRSIISATLLMILAACNNSSKPDDTNLSPADNNSKTVIYSGGDIITMEGDSAAYAESVVSKDGKIIFVGDLDDARKLAGDSTEMIDLQGKTLLPAFLDGHSHYISSLTVANQANCYAPPAGPGSDVAGIIASLQKFAKDKNVQAGEFIQAYGYDENAMPNGKLLNRDDLDKAFPNNPVMVGHVSMHGAVLNSAALKKYGYSADYVTPPGGVVIRKPGTNEPWGLIMETAYLPVFGALPKPTLEQEPSWSTAGQMMYAEAGITLAHEGATYLRDLNVIKRATDAGANIIDVVVNPFMTELDSIIANYPVDTWGKYNNHLKISAVKITADGSPQGKTAYFTTPYLTGGPAGEKNWKGEPTMSQDVLNALMRKVFILNVPLLVHTNGDATIDMFLKAYEYARNGDSVKPWNVTTIHTQFMRKDHITKFVKYKIRPSFYTEHTFYFATSHKQNRGLKQASYLSPMRDAIDAGLRPTNHTDFYVAPLDQLFMLWSAVNRISREGGVLGADQRVTPYEGLKAQTIWAAEQYDEQDRRGSLSAGKIADFVILDQNPLKVDPMTIKDIKVQQTIKEGKTIYKRG